MENRCDIGVDGGQVYVSQLESKVMTGRSALARKTKWRQFFIVIVVGSLIVAAGAVWQRQRVRADIQEYVNLLSVPLTMRNQGIERFRTTARSTSERADSSSEVDSPWKALVSLQQQVVDQLEAIHPSTGSVEELHDRQTLGLLDVEKRRLSVYETIANGEMKTAKRHFGSLADRTESWHQELAILCHDYGVPRQALLSDLIY